MPPPSLVPWVTSIKWSTEVPTEGSAFLGLGQERQQGEMCLAIIPQIDSYLQGTETVELFG